MGGRDSRNTYIIFALICLIVFNTGTILIRTWGKDIGGAGEDEAIPVFREDIFDIGDEEFYIAAFGRTSSIINLHRGRRSSRDGLLKYLDGSIPLKEGIQDIIRAQFPSVLVFNEGLEQEDQLKEEVEDSILDDFIIIDRIEEYEDLIVIDEGEEASPKDLPKPLNIKPLEIDEKKPYILLYHTHGTESYSSLENKVHHTTDRKYNVTTIGEIMAKALEAKGHKVEHVTKYHDIPSYSKSYAESLKTAREKLDQNDNLKILLDVHRDGFDHNSPKVKKNLKNILKKSKVKIGDKDVATFFFVIGPDSANKEQVLNFAKYFKVVSDVLYPGLCTGIVVKPVGKYNQFLSDYSALIEIGNNLNTMEEAEESAKLVGEILDLVIQNIRKK
ncbi:MAG TPA: stage II sporulation protein P [Tepidimicrobium sp.]|nr:stage II sporulation protein P [Tepidimicrobium sp.]